MKIFMLHEICFNTIKCDENQHFVSLLFFVST